jgi:UDP-N-acetylmuramoyl-tripeptide--D-alanyl-D-alanine ligase
MRAPAQIIGVTGSAGKTSVVQALRQALERAASTHASIKSYNNHVGVPLSVARMPRQSRYGVFEVGMSGAGEVAHGAKIIQPDIAIVTTVGAAHAENFRDEEGIANEKASLISALPKGGMAIIGLDHPHSERLISEARTVGAMAITVSVLEDADVHPIRMTEHHNCTCLTANIFGTPVTYKIAQPGREWVLNSLIVLAAVKAAGADLGQAALALAALEAEPGRGRAHELDLGVGMATLFDDSYNANPLSLRAALRRLSMAHVPAGGQRIAVLADMQELGEKSEEIHLSLIGDLKRFNVDRIIAFGDRMAELGKEAGVPTERWKNPKKSAALMMAQLKSGDAVMVKGANSAALYELVKDMLEIGRGEGEYPQVQQRHAVR